MRVIPRRSKDRPQDDKPARLTPRPNPTATPQPVETTHPTAPTQPIDTTRPGTTTQPAEPAEPAEPANAPQPDGNAQPDGTAQPDAQPGGTAQHGDAVQDGGAAGDAGMGAAVVAAAQPFHPAGGSGRDGAATAVLPAVPDSEAARRRARAATRRREAAEAKRSRAARRQGQPYREPVPPARAADQHRSALLVMVLTLGLLIAAVAVTGAMLASSMRTRPVTLAAPLHIYPVTQATPGPCPAGTQGVTGQAGSGPTCYRLTQGLAIHKVADMSVQKSRVKPGGYDVAVTLRPVDRDAFARLTRATVGRDLAFIVKGRLVTLPRVDMAITDGKVVVTGSPDRAAANTLVRELKGR